MGKNSETKQINMDYCRAIAYIKIFLLIDEPTIETPNCKVSVIKDYKALIRVERGNMKHPKVWQVQPPTK